MLLREMETANGFYHTITPHIDDSHPTILKMHRSYSRDPNLQKMTLDRGEMYLWRTLYTVDYNGMNLPILDSSAREWLDGLHRYIVKVSIEKSLEYYDDKNQIREIMLRRISDKPRVTPQPTVSQIPKFVTDALKRDAILANYTCPITMDPLTDIPVAITSCYHIFNHESIRESLQRNKNCPVCRKPVAFIQSI